MDSERRASIKRMYDALKRTYEGLQGRRLGCSPRCRDELLGAFLATVDVEKYLGPGPDEVADKCTFRELQKCVIDVRDMTTAGSAPGTRPEVCEKMARATWHCHLYGSSAKCDPRTFIPYCLEFGPRHLGWRNFGRTSGCATLSIRSTRGCIRGVGGWMSLG